jgi:hypothetical protein
MNPLTAELIRQGLRLAGVWLMTLGWLPAPIAELVADSALSEFAIGLISYAIAEGWWLASKARK